MPQRPDRATLGPHPDDARALSRTRFEVSEWDQLNWYVQFSARPLKDLSPGERLTLKEEATAIERTLIRKIYGHESVPEIADRELQHLHSFFRQALTNLVTEGEVQLGPFELHVYIVHGLGLVSEHVGGRGLLGDRFMVYHFSKLLTHHPKAIQICPHCHKLFLQFRKNALYCSRACQSVATMRKLRGVHKKSSTQSKNIPTRRIRNG